MEWRRRTVGQCQPRPCRGNHQGSQGRAGQGIPAVGRWGWATGLASASPGNISQVVLSCQTGGIKGTELNPPTLPTLNNLKG